MKEKKVLILETVKVHWLAVISSIEMFKHAGWATSVYSSKSIRMKSTLLSKKCQKDNMWYSNTLFNLAFILFFKKFDLIVVSSSILNFKHKSGLKSFTRNTLKAIILIFFFLFCGRRQIIIQSIFFPSQVFEFKSKTKSVILKFLTQIMVKLMATSISGYNVIGDVVKKRLMIMKYTSKPIFNYYGTYFDSSIVKYPKKENRQLKITITGRIDQRRRDYSWVEKIKEEYRSKIQIILLGAIHSSEDKSVIRHFNDLGFEQPSFINGEFIEKENFEKCVLEADILILPTYNYNEDNEDVTYRGLGIFQDVIRYGKMVLTRKNTQVDTKKSESCLLYQDNKELCEMIYKLSDDYDYRKKIIQKGIDNASKFTLDKIGYVEEIERHLFNL